MKKTIIRAKHDSNFTQIINSTINDPNLSHEEIGFLIRLLSYADNWTFNESHILKKYPKNGRDNVRKIIKSLIEKGYLFKDNNQKKDKKGNWESKTITIFEDNTVYWKSVNGKSVNGQKNAESKSIIKIDTILPFTGNPSTENQLLDSSKHNNNISNNKEIILIKEEKELEKEKEFYFNDKKDIQDLLIQFGEVFNINILKSISNTEKLIKLNGKQTLSYWIDNMELLGQALKGLKQKETDNVNPEKYISKAFYDSIQNNKKLSDRYSNKVETYINQNFTRKKEMGIWEDAFINFNLTQPSIADRFFKLCENILDYSKTSEILRLKGNHNKLMIFLVMKYSFSDIKNLIDEVIIKNKYNYPEVFLKKYSYFDSALKNIEDFQSETKKQLQLQTSER